MKSLCGNTGPWRSCSLGSSTMKKENKQGYGGVFLRGLLMGICDVVPGISGGTIAFITGIYERLMRAVTAFSPQLVKDGAVWLVKRDKPSQHRFRERIRQLDILFLLALFTGIGISLLAFSKLIVFLLDTYFAYVMLFFVGLILASAKLLYESIEDHRRETVSFGLLGLLLGLSLLFLIPVRVEPSALLLFVSGFFAISAMFLPGISGAFVLLVLGTYEHLIGALHSLPGSRGDVALFLGGAILGAMTIARVVTFLLAKHRSKMLYALLGLVIGCLAIPLRQVIMEPASPSPFALLGKTACLVAGVAIVWAVHRVEKLLRQKRQSRKR